MENVIFLTWISFLSTLVIIGVIVSLFNLNKDNDDENEVEETKIDKPKKVKKKRKKIVKRVKNKEKREEVKEVMEKKPKATASIKPIKELKKGSEKPPKTVPPKTVPPKEDPKSGNKVKEIKNPKINDNNNNNNKKGSITNAKPIPLDVNPEKIDEEKKKKVTIKKEKKEVKKPINKEKNKVSENGINYNYKYIGDFSNYEKKLVTELCKRKGYFANRRVVQYKNKKKIYTKTIKTPRNFKTYKELLEKNKTDKGNFNTYLIWYDNIYKYQLNDNLKKVKLRS